MWEKEQQGGEREEKEGSKEGRGRKRRGARRREGRRKRRGVLANLVFSFLSLE